MRNVTIATSISDIAKVVNYHLKQGDEMKLEYGTGRYDEDLIKILW